jgi:hypothetical protein
VPENKVCPIWVGCRFGQSALGGKCTATLCSFLTPPSFFPLVVLFLLSLMDAFISRCVHELPEDRWALLSCCESLQATDYCAGNCMQPCAADASLNREPVKTRRLPLPSLSAHSINVWYDYLELKHRSGRENHHNSCRSHRHCQQ